MKEKNDIMINSLISFPPSPKKFDRFNAYEIQEENEYSTEEKLYIELCNEKTSIFKSFHDLLNNSNFDIYNNENIKKDINLLNSENEIAQIENSYMKKDFESLKKIVENSTIESNAKKFFLNLSYEDYLKQDKLYLKKLINNCLSEILDEIKYESINSIEKRLIIDHTRKLKNIKKKYIKEENININKQIKVVLIYPENRKWDSYEEFRYGDDIYDLIMRIYENHPNFNNIQISNKEGQIYNIDENKDKYLGLLLNNITEIYVKNIN